MIVPGNVARLLISNVARVPLCPAIARRAMTVQLIAPMACTSSSRLPTVGIR